jgi:hypothetical protein
MATTVSNDTPRGTNWTKIAVYCAAGAVLAFLLGKATHGLRHGHYEIVSPFSAQDVLRERMAEDMLRAMHAADHSRHLKSIGLTGYN